MKRILLAMSLLLSMAAAAVAQTVESVPKPEYRARRAAMVAGKRGAAVLLFSAAEPLLDFMPYRQDSDFYYLTGWTEPGAAILVLSPVPAATATTQRSAREAQGYREILFLPTRNLRMEQYTGVKMDAATPGAAAATGVDEVMPMSDLPKVLGERKGVTSMWIQPGSDAARATLGTTAVDLGLAANTYASSSQDVDTLITPLREVKSPAEIALLRKASDASIAGQLAGMRATRPGVRERTVAGVEIATMMNEGCERVSYAPIVGSGPNATTLHYSTNERTMEKGEVVVIDEAGERSMYASDITRTMPVDGHFTARQREIYEIVLGAQRAAAAAFVAGKMRLGGSGERGPEVKDTLDKVAYEYINTHGKDRHGHPLGQYFLHGLGHSVGLDVHDPYDSSKPIDKGWVFTIEPGIYIPEERIGIRIEDVFYVDQDGTLVDLITKLPHEPAEVESAMRR